MPRATWSISTLELMSFCSIFAVALPLICSLSYNQLEEIPGKIKQLKNLTALEIGSNSVRNVRT